MAATSVGGGGGGGAKVKCDCMPRKRSRMTVSDGSGSSAFRSEGLAGSDGRGPLRFLAYCLLNK